MHIRISLCVSEEIIYTWSTQNNSRIFFISRKTHTWLCRGVGANNACCCVVFSLFLQYEWTFGDSHWTKERMSEEKWRRFCWIECGLVRMLFELFFRFSLVWCRSRVFDKALCRILCLFNNTRDQGCSIIKFEF